MSDYDEDYVSTIVVHKFVTEKEYDDFCLAAQWPEDRDRFARLVNPTPLHEILGE
jgi:hypothetical protein